MHYINAVHLPFTIKNSKYLKKCNNFFKLNNFRIYNNNKESDPFFPADSSREGLCSALWSLLCQRNDKTQPDYASQSVPLADLLTDIRETGWLHTLVCVCVCVCVCVGGVVRCLCVCECVPSNRLVRTRFNRFHSPTDVAAVLNAAPTTRITSPWRPAMLHQYSIEPQSLISQTLFILHFWYKTEIQTQQGKHKNESAE